MSLCVEYRDVPVGAQENAVITATAAQPFSQVEMLKNPAADMIWATFESQGWPLDGSRRLMPDTPNGWWSDVCSGADGSFADPPILTMCFPKPYTADGITLSFYPSQKQWCSEVEILWYRGNSLLERLVAYPDTAEWILTHTVANFDKVVIRLLKTNIPGHYAKLRQLQIGRVFVFMGDELVKACLLNEIDPALSRLSVDTMTVDIHNRRDHPLSPKKDQTIRLYQNGQQIATHYLTDAIRQSQHNYRLRCQSAIGRLEDTFLGGFYTEYPLTTLLQEVLGDFPFRVDSMFAEETVTGYLPVCTRREVLQQIAFGVGAVVTTRGDGSIQLMPPAQHISGSFAADSIFNGAKLKQESAVAAVELYIHSYTSSDEEKTIFKEREMHGEEQFLVFSEPCYSYRLTGGTILDCNVNWIRFKGDGIVTLKIKKYNHDIAVLSKKNPQATAAEKGNVVKVENATLIHRGNAAAALERLYQYHTMQTQLTQDVVVSGQYAGQLVRSLNPWGEMVQGYITEMDSTFTQNGHRASIQIRGREVEE